MQTATMLYLAKPDTARRTGYPSYKYSTRYHVKIDNTSDQTLPRPSHLVRFNSVRLASVQVQAHGANNILPGSTFSFRTASNRMS